MKAFGAPKSCVRIRCCQPGCFSRLDSTCRARKQRSTSCPFLPSAHGLGNLRWAGGGLLPLHPLPFPVMLLEASESGQGKAGLRKRIRTSRSLVLLIWPCACCCSRPSHVAFFPWGALELGIHSAGDIPVDKPPAAKTTPPLPCQAAVLGEPLRYLQPTAVLSFQLPPATHTSRTCHAMDVQIALTLLSSSGGSSSRIFQNLLVTEPLTLETQFESS